MKKKINESSSFMNGESVVNNNNNNNNNQNPSKSDDEATILNHKDYQFHILNYDQYPSTIIAL